MDCTINREIAAKVTNGRSLTQRAIDATPHFVESSRCHETKHHLTRCRTRDTVCLRRLLQAAGSLVRSAGEKVLHDT
jgi:hypothetical protein